jgi:predicted transposase YdaD
LGDRLTILKVKGKLAAVRLLLKAGLTVEQIAEQLDIDIQAVRQAGQQS